jgi:hypothetical protein
MTWLLDGEGTNLRDVHRGAIEILGQALLRASTGDGRSGRSQAENGKKH